MVHDVVKHHVNGSSLLAHSATFNPFYYNDSNINDAFSRLVFGGIESEELVRTYIESDYQGNNRRLESKDLIEHLLEIGENIDTNNWIIPSNSQPHENGESGYITEIGKKRHRGVTCRLNTDCFPDNYLIGGMIDGFHSSRAIYKWNDRGFVDANPDSSSLDWNAAPPLIEGRRDFAAVALSNENPFCKMILVCGGEGSRLPNEPVPNYLKSCECLTRIENGVNQWIRSSADLFYPVRFFIIKPYE